VWIPSRKPAFLLGHDCGLTFRPIITTTQLTKEKRMDSDTRTRLFQEHSDVQHRLGKLEKFIQSPKFEELSGDDQSDLHEQHRHMRAYRDVLTRRAGRQCNNA